MKHRKTQRENGTTLIELMIYLGITSGILLGVGSVGFNVIAQKQKSYAVSEVHYAESFFSEILAGDIRASTGISVPLFPGTSSTTLVLASTLASKNPTIYSIADGIVLRQSGTSTTERVLPPSILLTNAVFVRTGATGTDQSIELRGQLSTGSGTLGTSLRFRTPLVVTSSLRAPQP